MLLYSVIKCIFWITNPVAKTCLAICNLRRDLCYSLHNIWYAISEIIAAVYTSKQLLLRNSAQCLCIQNQWIDKIPHSLRLENSQSIDAGFSSSNSLITKVHTSTQQTSINSILIFYSLKWHLFQLSSMIQIAWQAVKTILPYGSRIITIYNVASLAPACQ